MQFVFSLAFTIATFRFPSISLAFTGKWIVRRDYKTSRNFRYLVNSYCAVCIESWLFVWSHYYFPRSSIGKCPVHRLMRQRKGRWATRLFGLTYLLMLWYGYQLVSVTTMLLQTGFDNRASGFHKIMLTMLTMRQNCVYLTITKNMWYLHNKCFFPQGVLHWQFSWRRERHLSIC